MNILVLGAGGREHALVTKISESPLCTHIYTAPGNPGTVLKSTNVDIDPTDFEALHEFSVKNKIDLIIPGPELPLVLGIRDYFEEKSKGSIRIFGPLKQGALLEGSKIFAKQFMAKYDIPTASYAVFGKEQISEAVEYVKKHTLPIVLKADGLASGKGVVIAHSTDEAVHAVKTILKDRLFGSAGDRLVVEQFLQGRELSVFVVTDGSNYCLLPEAKDYKRIGEGDQGPNTGGMGAVSPVPFVSSVLMEKIETRIIRPTLEGLRKENIDYKGFIFFGLMEVSGEPYVIEYNVRLGDPEAETILPRLKTDILELMYTAADRELSQSKIQVSPQASVTVFLASEGYPGDHKAGETVSLPFTFQDESKCSQIFYAGVKASDSELLTSGGRVFAVNALGDTIQQAQSRAYEIVERVSFEGKYFRRDIGNDLFD